jgi:hypothetical protein
MNNIINLDKALELIKDFLESKNLWDFLNQDSSLYIGGSLPFTCLSPRINSIDEIEVGDIDIYTTNWPLLLRNINKNFKVNQIIKTGVNVKFEIENNNFPIQIITSPFENFKTEVLDEYDCGLVSVGFHPNSNKFIIHPNFISQLESNEFIVIREKTNPARIEKLTERAYKLFGSNLREVITKSDGDYRPYWLNKVEIESINDVMPSPPYTQLYAHKYHCMGCKQKQSYFICKLCQLRMKNHFVQTIGKNDFKSKFSSVVVFGGLNGLGKIIGDEIIQIGFLLRVFNAYCFVTVRIEWEFIGFV